MTIRQPAPVQGYDGIGWQCLLDLHGCRTKHLDSLEWVRKTMLEAADKAGATVVGDHFHRFEPHGISGVVVIAESHLAIHIWPERSFAAVDLFTCSSQLELMAAANWLAQSFCASEHHIRFFGRGDGAAGIASFGEGLAQPTLQQGAREAGLDDLYIEQDDSTGGHWFLCHSTIECSKTEFQNVEIMDFAHFGRVLCLDGRLQSAESDEYIYHEALVQPALVLHNRPRRVLIVGGGEGATAREVLKHDAVERLDMVDIDGQLVELARNHLATWHRRAFDDPRLRLYIQDGYNFVRTARQQYDVVILDVVDSFDGSPAAALFSPEFFRLLKDRLAPGGILVVQAMECYAGEYEDHLRVRLNLCGLFRNLRSYVAFVPSYRSLWGFVMASDEIDPALATAEQIDNEIRGRHLQAELRFYDGKTHRAQFALSKDIRRLFGEAG